MRKTSWIFPVAVLALLVLCTTASPAEESFDYVVAVGNEKLTFVARPELGYVVKTQQKTGSMSVLSSTLSFLASEQTKPIRGLDRYGVWVVENERPRSENENAIGLLKAHGQVQYAAPLFSSNGQTIAIIPEIVVRVKPDTNLAELESLCESMDCRIKKRMEFTTQEYLLEVLGPDAEAVFTALDNLNNVEWIEWAAPNTASQRKRSEPAVSEMHYSAIQEHLSDDRGTSDTSGFIPNDEYFPYQWHLHNTGQFGGTPDADISAPEAWEITAGDPNIVVCVLLNGVDLDHPDLVNNLVPGYDFFDNDDLPESVGSNPYEASSTACAGLVAAEGNNDIGVVGVAWKCKVMPVRIGTYNFIRVSDAVEGLRWAAANGADILSNSWGFTNPILHSAIVDITKSGGIGRDGKGCVVLFAAGNWGGPIPPGDIDTYPEVIAVGATDQNDVRWSYSVYGPGLEIVAPSGQRGLFLRADPDRWSNEASMILSTDIEGQPGLSSDPAYKYGNELDYSFYGGTSGACPITAGVAALILSVEPELTNEEVRHFLCRSAKDLGDPGRDDYYGWGRVDARAALDMVLAKRADLNNDWKVDLSDFAVFAQCWKTDDVRGDIGPVPRPDGVLDVQDIALMSQYWLKEIPDIRFVAHWKLDEVEGSIAYDSVGSNDGTLNGDPNWQPTAGKVDGSLKFNGTNNYISTDFVLNPVSESFSVFAWIKGDAPGQVIISQAGGANWLLADPSEGKLKTELKASGRFGNTLLSQTVITDGDWHRIGLVWDGSNRTLYVDGIEAAKDTQSNLTGSEADLHIGAGKILEEGSFFSGLIDDVRIYNVALSPEEIEQLAR